MMQTIYIKILKFFEAFNPKFSDRQLVLIANASLNYKFVNKFNTAPNLLNIKQISNDVIFDSI